MKRIIVFGVACLTILLFAIPSYSIVYVSGDFTTDKWVEEFKGGGPGQPGNTLKAKGHGFDFKKAVLDNTVPTGAVDEYMTTYTGGELKLKAKGPWVDKGELKDTDITATNVSTFNNATGKLIFTLTFCGEFDNAPGVWYAVKVTYDGYPGFKLKDGVLKSQTGYSPGFKAIIVIEEGGACPLIGTSGELICDGTNIALIQPCTETGSLGNVCEGEQECTVYGWGPCNLPEEICDGVDNNCDGVIDEGFGYQDYNGAKYPGEACGTGACSGGVVECSADGGVECSTDVYSQTEVCNDIDDDCDGEVDEGCSTEAYLVINEIDYTQESGDIMEFVEILNIGLAVDLAGLSVEFFNGANQERYLSIDLTEAGILPYSSFLVIGPQGLPISSGALKIDFQNPSSNIQNGPDCIRIVGPQGIIDSVSYEGSVVSCNEGVASVEDEGPGSIGRVPDGADTNINGVDFLLLGTPTPGGPNDY